MAKNADTNARLIGGLLMLAAITAAIVIPLEIAGNAVIETQPVDGLPSYWTSAEGVTIYQVVVFDRDYDLTGASIVVGINPQYDASGIGDVKVQFRLDDLGGSTSLASMTTTLDAISGNIGGAPQRYTLDLSLSVRVTAGKRYGFGFTDLDHIGTGPGSNVVRWYFMDPNKASVGASMEKEVFFTGAGTDWDWDDALCQSQFNVSCQPANLRVLGGAVGGTPDPVAAFSWTSQNLTANFTDLSQPPANGTIQLWTWDFGDKTNQSTQQNPVHTYAAAGTYAVKLVVVGSNGKTDDATTQVTVVLNQNKQGSTTSTGGTTATAGLVFHWSWLLLAFALVFGVGTYMVSKGYVKKDASRVLLAFLTAAGYILIFGLVL